MTDATEQAAVGLAHRRLSIIDTRSVGQQPMVSASGHVIIAFNGEFYGYRAARTLLEKRGHQFRTETDTEVILGYTKNTGSTFFLILMGCLPSPYGTRPKSA